MKFRARYAEIEAVQWFPGSEHPGVREQHFADGRSCGYGFCVTVHEQQTRVDPGDWVVVEPTNSERHYPVKPDIFERRWEPIPA